MAPPLAPILFPMPAFPPPAIAATFKLDRSVIIAAQSDAKPTQLRVGELAVRDCCVVLLAEPGMGKTTVLEQMAAAAGTESMQVRTFLIEEARTLPNTSSPLFLDGLDEYRADGGDADKIERLASRLRQNSPARWWLSCRAEDWTKRDLEALKGAAGGREIVVARLAPLDIRESWEVLSALGDPDPNALVERAKALGGAAFLRNPLSLKLLLRSVNATGEIPRTRFALYEGATCDLAAEHNELYDGTERAGPSAVLSSARRICALLLLANRSMVWRSTLAVPRDDGYLNADDLGLPSALVADTLNTALFTSADSGKFEPLHRTVAEFLAGRALAEAVAGGTERPRFPLGRALALITGAEGLAPAPLRGVYGWMAVHLSTLGQHYAVEQMCHRDASTVLVYGDARALTTPARKALLSSLDRADPWFRDSEEADPAAFNAAVGGLAGEDLAEDFERLLRQPNDSPHLFAIVTDAVAYGDKVPRLLPELREIAMDQNRPHFERVRSAGALTMGSADPSAAAAELFRALRNLPSSESNVALSVSLANRFADTLILDDLQLINLLKDHAASTDKAIGHLVKLRIHLQAFPRLALMAPSVNQTFSRTGSAAVREVWAFLDSNAVGLLRSASPPSPEEVWAWLKSRDRTVWEQSESDVSNALQYWIRGSGREEALFLAILRSEASTADDWFPGRVFVAKVGRYPSAAMAEALLIPAGGPFHAIELSDRIGVATALAIPAGCVAEIRAGIAALPTDQRARGERQLAERLADEAARQTAARQNAEIPGRFIAQLRKRLSTPISSLDTPEGKSILKDAADYQFRVYADASCAESDLPLVDFVGVSAASIISTGWQALARSAAERSAAEIARDGCSQEILAGIGSLVALGEPLPLGAALLVLRGELLAHRADGVRLDLLVWAWQALETAGSQGAQALLEFWETEAKCSGRCSGIPYQDFFPSGTKTLGDAVQRLLWRDPCLTDAWLRHVLEVAAKVVSVPEMRKIARYFLARELPGSETYLLWLSIAFAIEPEEFLDRFQQTFGLPNAPELVIVYGMISAFARRLEPAERALVAATIFRIAVEKDGDSRSEWVGASLNQLISLRDPAARRHLLAIESDPRFSSVKHLVRSTLARQARSAANRSFIAASPQRVAEALAGGRPVNASDLRAIVQDELHRIQDEMQRDPLMPWQLFWSDEKISSAGEAAEVASSHPKIENKCRNVIGLLLQARLGHYGIVHRPVPEAQRAAETRVDLTCESVAGAALPIEMKRQHHKDLWIAAEGQLQGYTADHAAGGLGIYVVFWFGAKFGVPAHPHRTTKPEPTSAEELQALLLEDLPERLRETTDIFVIDVSDPKAAKQEKTPRKPRAKGRAPAKKVPTKKSQRSAPIP